MPSLRLPSRRQGYANLPAVELLDALQIVDTCPCEDHILGERSTHGELGLKEEGQRNTW